MGPHILDTFANYHNYKGKEGKEPHKIAFAIPGLVFGMNYSILQTLSEIAKKFDRSHITLYVYTWKTSFNLPFLTRLNAICKDTAMFPKVNLKYVAKTYEETNLLGIAKRLAEDLGVDPSAEFSFDHTNFKRLVYFYVHFLTYQFIYKDLSKYAIENGEKTLIFRLSPKLKLVEREYIHSGFNEMLYTVFSNLSKHLSPDDLKKINHPYDVLHLTDASSSSYDDLFYASSPHTLVNIFGVNEEDFYQKLLSFYTKYLGNFPGSIKTCEDLTLYGRSPSYLPLEGSTIMKHFADNSKVPVVHQSCRFLGNFLGPVMEFNSPWYTISGSEFVPPEELKEDKHLRSHLNFEINKNDFIITRNSTAI